MEFQVQKIENFKGQARLPKFAVPKRYDLTLKLDLSASAFSGTVVIDVSIDGPTKFLVLNSLELVIHGVSFTNSNDQKYVPCEIVVDSDDEILVLVFEEVLTVGYGVLAIEFSGVPNEHLKGLYRCTYTDKGEKKNTVATQFEAVDARRCFPCWDEPSLKATFKITLESIPLEMTALSNMPIAEEKVNRHFKTIHFEESVLMSTYLVAIVVGLFDYVEDTTDDGIKVRAYCPAGKSEKGKFALNIAVKTLDFFQMYFSTPYPLPKMDMVAVPEFSGGAMENYGLITFRENELLQDELYSAAANIQRLTIVVAHEVAHHWFGNLVTMEWWTHLWLNEGFATWISYLVTDKIFPEWNIWNRFLQETEDGLRMDALEQSHPIEVEIPKARAVLEYFDAISYQKGCSFIRMLENFLGDKIFQKSLGSYMKKFAFSNAKTEDLWSVISETSGIEVNKITDTWTKQKGYPVITVELKDTTLKFEQKQFLSSGLDSSAQWIVPVTLSVSSYDNQKRFLLEAKQGQLDIGDVLNNCPNNIEENWWIKINANQTGFYRVKYDQNLAARLQKAISSSSLSATDEFGILDDTFALCEAGLMPFSSLLHLMDTYRKDLEYIVLSRLIDVCNSASRIIRDAIPELESDLNRFFITLLLPHAEKLGWDAVPGESQLDALKREQVLTALAKLDHSETKKEAINRFRAYLNDQNSSLLPVNIRKVTLYVLVSSTIIFLTCFMATSRQAAYMSVIRDTSSADKSGLQWLQKLHKEVDAPQEKARILRKKNLLMLLFLQVFCRRSKSANVLTFSGCIASCPDPVIVSDVLDFLLTDELPPPDIVFVLPGISWEGRETAWTWFKANWDVILKKWGAEMLLTSFVRGIIKPFCSNEMANEVEAFFCEDPLPSIELSLKQSVEIVRIKARWVQHIKQEQEFLGELVKGLASK